MLIHLPERPSEALLQSYHESLKDKGKKFEMAKAAIISKIIEATPGATFPACIAKYCDGIT